MLSILKNGDQILITQNCYEPVYNFAKNELQKFGVEISFYPNNLEKLESKLSSFFGTKISTKGDEKSGKIIIPYKSTNDLNRILELLDII